MVLDLVICQGPARSSCPAGATSGPRGVTLTLTSAADASATATTVSSDGGAFRFANVFPGAYTLMATHDVFAVAPASQAISIGWENAQLASPFRVAGYTVRGTVRSGPTTPVAGVSVFVYGSASDSASRDGLTCAAPAADLAVPPGRAATPPLCHALTDAAGEFSFPGLPCGLFTLVPYYHTPRASFDVSPAELPVTVDHVAVTVTAPFVVSGFAATGRVVNRDGTGLAGVTVKLAGSWGASPSLPPPCPPP